MTSPAEIFRDAMALPAEAWSALADSLLESLDSEPDEGAEEAWRIEIRRRLNEIDSAEVRMIPWAEVRQSLWSQLER